MTSGLIAGHPVTWRRWQKGGARAVLALHCSLAHAGAWSGLVERLAGVTVTAPDLPGHGRSGDWDGLVDLHDLSTRIAVAMAEGQGGTVDLIGHSFGATVALRMALERPDLIRSLVLIEPVLFAAARVAGAPEWPPFAADHAGLGDLMARDRQAAAAVFHGHWGAGDFATLAPAQRRYMIERMHLVRAQDDVLLRDAAGMLVPGRLEALACPVLLLEGADSPPIVAAIQRALAERLPQVRRVVIAGAGHMLPITHPDAVAQAVQAHLAAS